MPNDDPLGRAKALYEMSVTPQRTAEMLELLDRSVAETAAYAAVTDLCRYLNRWERTTPADLDRFEQVIQRALLFNPHYYLALYAQGFLYRARGQHEAALAAFEETIKYAPDGFARVHAQKGEELVYLGRFDDGIAEAKIALDLNADSKVRGYFHWVIGRAQFFNEKYPDAIASLERSVEAWPDVWYNRAYLAAAHGHRGNKADAQRVLRALHRKFSRYTLERVIRNEGATPCEHHDVKAGRERFHDGLRRAGLS
jgi:tetratricopeptide (TPR) repeat protein